MRLAGRFARRVRASAAANGIPVIDCTAEQHEDLADALRAARAAVLSGYASPLYDRLYEPATPVLRILSSALGQIEPIAVESHHFASPHPGDSTERAQRLVGVGAIRVRQTTCRPQDPGDLAHGVQVGPSRCLSWRPDQPGWGSRWPGSSALR